MICAGLALAAIAACAPKEEAAGESATEDTATEEDSSIPAPTQEGVATHITAADEDKTVEVRVGTRVQVELSGVPTAGYMWAVKEAPAFLTAAGEAGGPTNKAQLEPGFAGGNHWEVYFFDVTGEGTGVLRLEQVRAWESDEPAVDTFSVTINAVAG
jgi:predicted secreted protein